MGYQNQVFSPLHQTTPFVPLQLWAFPPLHWLGCRLTRLQLLHFLFSGFFLFMCFLLPLILSCFLFMHFLLPLILSCFLFMHFPLILILSCLSFMYFLPLWLCLVSSCISCHCGFARFHLALLLQNQNLSLFPYTRALWAFCHIYQVGLADHFAFFSLHLFTTLGWAYWPFYFLFSSFIHYIGLGLLTLYFLFSSFTNYIGLGLLTLLLSFLFIYSLHQVGLADPFAFFSLPLILLGLTYWAPFHSQNAFPFQAITWTLFMHSLLFGPSEYGPITISLLILPIS